MKVNWKTLMYKIRRGYKHMKLTGNVIKKGNDEVYKSLLEEYNELLQGYKRTIQNPDNSDSVVTNMFSDLLNISVNEKYKMYISEDNTRCKKEVDDILKQNIKLIQDIHSLIILSRGDIIPEEIENKYNKFIK